MQQICDAAYEPWQVERLGEEIIRLHRHRALGDFARERAHEDHRNLFRGGLAVQDFAVKWLRAIPERYHRLTGENGMISNINIRQTP